MFDLDIYKNKMNDAFSHFEGELAKVRTGRAHPAMLDSIRVEVYGTYLPLNQISNVTAPEAGTLLITPFDPSNIISISAAIRSDQALGLNPSDDGRVVRVPVPPLTEERRRQIAKQTSEKVEDARISLRNIRQDAIKDLKKLKESKEISEDQQKRSEKEIDELTKDFQAKIEAAFKQKEAEIMKV